MLTLSVSKKLIGRNKYITTRVYHIYIPKSYRLRENAFPTYTNPFQLNVPEVLLHRVDFAEGLGVNLAILIAEIQFNSVLVGASIQCKRSYKYLVEFVITFSANEALVIYTINVNMLYLLGFFT